MPVSNSPDAIRTFPAKVTPWNHISFTLVTLLYWITLYVYMPILPPYLESLGLHYFLIGIILGSYGFVQILLRFPVGILSDWKQVSKPFLIMGLATGALSCFIFAFSEGWEWSLVARSIAGISASSWVAFTVLYANYHDNSHVLHAMGYVTTVSVFGQLMGMGLCGFIVDLWGWNGTFWAGGVIGLLGLIVSFAIKEPARDHLKSSLQRDDIITIMQEAFLLKVSLLSVLANSVLFITMFGFTPLQALSVGASESDLSVLACIFMLPFAASSYLASRRIVPRIGIWNAVMLGFVGSSLFTLLLPLMPSFFWLSISQAFNGFTQGIHISLLLGLAIHNVDLSKRATAMGLYQSIYSIGMFMGPFLAGWLDESFGLVKGFYFGSALSLLGALLTLVWKREKKNVVRRLGLTTFFVQEEHSGFI